MRVSTILVSICIFTALFITSCLSSFTLSQPEVNGKPIEDCYIYDGHTYIIINVKNYWHEAREKCEEVGGHLIIINSNIENMLLSVRCADSTWIGLSDEKTEGKFQWADGTWPGFTNWGKNQPDDLAASTGYPQDYACFKKSTDWQWDDWASSSRAYFICEFDFIIDDLKTLTGIQDYLKGSSTVKLVAKITDKDSLVEEIIRAAEKEKLDYLEVKKTLDGLKICLEDIMFKPDSIELLNTETGKLIKLGNVLARFKDYSIRVVGHTAEWGTAESCLDLSRKRARIIKDFFINHDYFMEDHIQVDGRGYFEPIGDNKTEEGRKKNRRVEIIILDK